MVVVAGATGTLPLVALLAVHPLVAAQDVAPELDQLIVEDCPAVMEVGLAAIDTVGTLGAGVTVTVVSLLPVPPAPVQRIV